MSAARISGIQLPIIGSRHADGEESRAGSPGQIETVAHEREVPDLMEAMVAARLGESW